jgi:urease accessory protein
MNAQHLSYPDIQGYGKERNWRASLELQFRNRNGRTALTGMTFRGPLRVQRPFYPEGNVCHLYVLHPPAGIVSGDQLTININNEKGTHALLTTPSATKIYKADSHNVPKEQCTKIQASSANVEWLPHETIFYSGANGELRTRVELNDKGRYIGWETICLGRPACDEKFKRGRMLQHIEIWREGKPLLIERQQLTADNPILLGRFGFAGYPVSGTMVACGFNEEPQALLNALHEILNRNHCAVTYRNGVLIARYLGSSSEEAMDEFIKCWQLLRPTLFGRSATIPRIWYT